MKKLVVVLIALALFGALSCSSSDKMWYLPLGYWDMLNVPGSDAYNPEVAMDKDGNILVAWIQYDYDGHYQLYMAEYIDGKWTVPTDLTGYINPEQTTGDWIFHRVAMDKDGNAIIAWVQDGATNEVVYVSEKRNGTWTHPADLTDIFSADGGDAWNVNVAMDDNGNAIVVWYQDNGSNDMIYEREYRNGAWSAVPALATDNFSPTGQDVFRPRLAMDNNGNAIIVWEQSNGSNDMVYKREYRSGAWSDEPVLATDNFSPTGQSVDRPEVAMSDNGDAVIAWEQSDGSDDLIYMREYRSGAWSGEPVLATNYFSPSGEDAEKPEVEMDKNGNTIVAWEQSDGSYNRIYMREYRDGTWSSMPALTTAAYPDGVDGFISPWAEYNCCSYQHSVAMDDNGNALVAYEQEYYNDFIYKSEYRNGVWAHPTLNDWLNAADFSYDSDYSYRPMSAMSNSGNAIIAWYGYDHGEEYAIYMAHYR